MVDLILLVFVVGIFKVVFPGTMAKLQLFLAEKIISWKITIDVIALFYFIPIGDDLIAGIMRFVMRVPGILLAVLAGYDPFVPQMVRGIQTVLALTRFYFRW